MQENNNLIRNASIVGVEMDLLENSDFCHTARNKLIVICKHCGKKVDRVKLKGLSLICPFCGKPQNGQPHTNMTGFKYF
jgi:hypothetical protein